MVKGISMNDLIPERKEYKEYDFLGNDAFLELFNELKNSNSVKPLIEQVEDADIKNDKSTEDVVSIILTYEFYRQVYKNKEFNEGDQRKMRHLFDASYGGISELVHIYRNIKASEGYVVGYGLTFADRSKGFGTSDLNTPSCFSFGDVRENVFKFTKTGQKGKKKIDETNIGDKKDIQGCFILDDDPREIKEVRLYYVEKELKEGEENQANTLKACKYRHHSGIQYPSSIESQNALDNPDITCGCVWYGVLDCDNKIGRNDLDLIVEYEYNQLIEEYGINREKVAKGIKELLDTKLKSFEITTPKKSGLDEQGKLIYV